MPQAQAGFLRPEPPLDIPSFNTGPLSQDFYGMEMYPPFAGNNFPMDLGGYADTFNWVSYPRGTTP
jgi:hypothetical protein